MNIFEGIEHVFAEGISNRQYFEPGNYVVTIDTVFIHEKRLGGGKLFIVETVVTDSDNPNIKPGDKKNWVQSLSLPSALPRIKTFLGASMGLCTKSQLKEINSSVTTDVCNQAVSPKNPLKGKILKLECLDKISRTGKNFTQHVWQNYNQ